MGDTLAVLIEEVQYEIGHDVSPAVGKNFREHIKARIRREDRRLYHDFDWPHLEVWETIDLSAGERYYDIPGGLSLDTVQSIWRWWGERWDPLDRGIPLEAFSVHNSDADERNEPVQLWRPYGAAQIEIWPIPSASITDGLRFIGKAPYSPLIEEDDVCALDTDLVVLHAAGELARRYRTEDANIILARAKQHYETLKSRCQRGGIRVDFTRGPQPIRSKGFADKLIIGVDRE